MYNEQKIAAVVLAYNVEKFIAKVIEDMPEFIDRVYVVNDGSTDNTIEKVKLFNHGRIKLIHNETNRGPGFALCAGYKEALNDEMDVVIKIDGDGQMPLAEIYNLVIPITEGKADYTKGDRLSKDDFSQDMPLYRLFGNRVLTWLTRVASGYWHLNDSQNGFTAISKRALETVGLDLYSYHGYLNDLLIRLNVHHFKILDISMPAKYGAEKSTIRLQTYIYKVSFLLLRKFMWRLKLQYILPKSFLASKRKN